MTRKIVLDFETTGLNPDSPSNPDRHMGISAGHRIVEIGAVEIIDCAITGLKFQTYLNPNMEVSAEAYRINGLNWDMLRDKPQFSDIVASFKKFIRGSVLIMHNSAFDLNFLDRELAICGAHPVVMLCKDTICTKKKSGGLSLNELCAKYGIDTSHRKVHGALMDAELTARCYLAIRGDDDPLIFRSTVNDCLDEFYSKYSEKPEGVLIQEIKAKMESLL